MYDKLTFMNATVKALIIDSKQNALILFRSKTHPLWAHHHDLPGGTLENDEQFIDTLVREIEEETSLVLPKESFNEASEESIDDNNKYILCTSRIDEIPVSEIKLSWEHSHFELISIDELKTIKLPKNADKYFISVQDYIKRNL